VAIEFLNGNNYTVYRDLFSVKYMIGRVHMQSEACNTDTCMYQTSGSFDQHYYYKFDVNNTYDCWYNPDRTTQVILDQDLHSTVIIWIILTIIFSISSLTCYLYATRMLVALYCDDCQNIHFYVVYNKKSVKRLKNEQNTETINSVNIDIPEENTSNELEKNLTETTNTEGSNNNDEVKTKISKNREFHASSSLKSLSEQVAAEVFEDDTVVAEEEEDEEDEESIKVEDNSKGSGDPRNYSKLK